DQRVVRAFESEPVGDVLIDEQEAAQGMRRHRHAERAAVGQMYQLVLRLDERCEETDLLTLEHSEIGEFRDAPALAQAFQNLVERGVTGKPVLFDAPE